MANKIEADSWPARLALTVGQQVKLYRERPEFKISAQILADRTAVLGHEIKRSVIANLESGRRDFVTLSDVLVLAAALDVPPMALIVPIQRGGRVEVLNGAFVSSPWDAIDWINGLGRYIYHENPDGTAEWQGSHLSWHTSSAPFNAKLFYDVARSQLHSALIDAEETEGLPEAHAVALSRIIEIKRELRSIREDLDELGVEVPARVDDRVGGNDYDE